VALFGASLNEELNYIRGEPLIRGDGCRMRSRLLQCMSPEVALFRHGAMSDLSLLCAPQQTGAHARPEMKACGPEVTKTNRTPIGAGRFVDLAVAGHSGQMGRVEQVRFCGGEIGGFPRKRAPGLISSNEGMEPFRCRSPNWRQPIFGGRHGLPMICKSTLSIGQ
jgi:hypothetical protein